MIKENSSTIFDAIIVIYAALNKQEMDTVNNILVIGDNTAGDRFNHVAQLNQAKELLLKDQDIRQLVFNEFQRTLKTFSFKEMGDMQEVGQALAQDMALKFLCSNNAPGEAEKLSDLTETRKQMVEAINKRHDLNEKNAHVLGYDLG